MIDISKLSLGRLFSKAREIFTPQNALKTVAKTNPMFGSLYRGAQGALNVVNAQRPDVTRFTPQYNQFKATLNQPAPTWMQRPVQAMQNFNQSALGAPGRAVMGQGNSVPARVFKGYGDTVAKTAMDAGTAYGQNFEMIKQGVPLSGRVKPLALGGWSALKGVSQMTPKGLLASSIPGALGAGIAKIQGNDPAYGAGQSMAEFQGWRPLLNITNPVISKVSNTLAPKIMGESSGVAKFLLSQATQRGVHGAGNVIEDEILDKLNQLPRNNWDRLFSLAIGAGMAGNQDLIKGAGDYLFNSKALKQLIKNADVQQIAKRTGQPVKKVAQQVLKTIDDNQQYRLRFTEKGSIPFDQMMDKKTAQSWSYSLGSRGIEYKLEPMGYQGGFVQGKVTQPPTNPLEVEAIPKVLSDLSKEAQKMDKQSFIDQFDYLFDQKPDNFYKGSASDFFNQSQVKPQAAPLKLELSGQTANPQVAGKLRISNTPELGTGKAQILPRIVGNQGSTKVLPKVSQGLETPKASSNEIISLKPRTALLKQAQQLEQLGSEQLSALKESAKSATDQRSFFNNDQIKDINRFKQFARSNAILEGDVETMRKKIPDKLTDKVLEYVEENLGIKDEEKALEVILNLPTKLDTKVRLPEEIRLAKELRAKAKQVTNLVFNSETDLEVKDKVLKNNLPDIGKDAVNNFREWQSQLFKQEGASRMTPNRLANRVAASIKQSTSPVYSKEVANLKDISEPGKGMTDVYRHFDRVFGPNSQAKREILEPFDKAKGDMVDDLENLATGLRKNVVDKFNFQKGSKESAAIQQYGEKLRDYNSLVKEFGKNKADNIVESDKWFRSAYDDLLKQVNEVRRKIYPNSPDKIIPRRSDYYRHFRDLSSTFAGLKNLFETPAGIDPALAGMSEYVKPKSKWLSFAQQRLGLKTEYDAVGGFLEYAQAQTYAKRIDPFIDRFRQLRTELVNSTSDAKTPEYGKLNNFIEFLDDYANDLAGKTNPADRALQKYIGRKPFRVLNWINTRTKANVILGNLSSAIAQFFNIPQGVAEAGIDNSGRGALRYLSSILKPDEAMNQSQFLKTRLKDPFSQFDVGVLASAKKTAIAITKFGDEVGTRYIWSSLYEKALKNGLTEPVKYADDMTRKMVAGRGIGEVPLLQKSKVFQLIAPFQLEVSNIWHVMKEWAGEKQAGKFVTFFVASYLMNDLAKRIRGNDVSFDPIGAGVDAVETAQEAENPQEALMLGAGRLAGEILSNLPFGQTLAGIYPEFGGDVLGSKLPTREKLFGEGDPTRFGSGLLAASSLQDPLTKLVPPFGGQQIKRTIEGLTSVNKGYSESQSGRVRFPVEKNLRNTIQAGAFGQYAIPEARKYFDSDTSTLGDKQSSAYKSILESQGVEKAKAFYDSIMNKRGKSDVVPTNGETSEDLSVIQAKFDNSPQLLTPQEIATYYESKVTKPSNSSYEQAIYEKDIWSQISNINSRDTLTQQQKDDASIALLSKIGAKPENYQYHEIAKQVNDLKSMYVEEELTKMMASGASKEDIYSWLVDQRREVNGKMVLAPGVIDDLVDKNIISYYEGKQLKAIKVDSKTKKVSSSGSKAKKAKKIKVPALKKIAPPKIPKVKIVAAKVFKAPKVKKIKIRKINTKIQTPTLKA